MIVGLLDFGPLDRRTVCSPDFAAVLLTRLQPFDVILENRDHHRGRRPGGVGAGRLSGYNWAVVGGLRREGVFKVGIRRVRHRREGQHRLSIRDRFESLRQTRGDSRTGSITTISTDPTQASTARHPSSDSPSTIFPRRTARWCCRGSVEPLRAGRPTAGSDRSDRTSAASRRGRSRWRVWPVSAGSPDLAAPTRS